MLVDPLCVLNLNLLIVVVVLLFVRSAGSAGGRRGCLHGMLLATAAKRTFLDFMLFEKQDFVIFGLPAVDV